MDEALRARLSRIAALKPARRLEAVEDSACSRDQSDRLASLLPVEVARNRYGEYLVTRNWHATPEACTPDLATLRLLLPAGPRVSVEAAEAAMDLSQWLFLDTETTGLAGGTGTYAFLVGLAWWDAGGIQIEQLFMRDHNEEHSVLLAIEQRLRERPILVTFNGKCFDWPLLETRFRMTRSIEVPAPVAHLDLLHPARQLWRWQLGSVRLSDLERHVLDAESLGWTRTHDIDSSRIPDFYFDYLRGGSAEPLAGVFRHNAMDLRGLAALAGRIFRALTMDDGAQVYSKQPLELYGISRFLKQRGERARASEFYERALGSGLPQPFDRTARHELARLAKRQREFDRAAALWQELATGSVPSFEACEQLAIHYERRARNRSEAERATRLALKELRRAHHLGLISEARHAQIFPRLQRRLERLGQKSRNESTSAGKSVSSPGVPVQGEFAPD